MGSGAAGWVRCGGVGSATTGGEDVADLGGLPVAVSVEHRVQVVQVGLAGVVGELAFELLVRSERMPGGAEPTAERGPQPGARRSGHGHRHLLFLQTYCVHLSVCLRVTHASND